MSGKINIYLRAMEKRDIPKVINWLSAEDYYKHNLTAYPCNNRRLLRNQLLKEIATSRMIETRTRLFVAEANNEILTGFITLQNFSWQNRNAALQIYIPAEFRTTDLGVVIAAQAYSYVFKDLGLNKVYTYVAGGNAEQLARYKNAKHEPEAVLYDYLRSGEQAEDLHIFGTFKRDVLKKPQSE
ncbi:MAG: GNAT family N-acetyltransferase [Candidatus Margulisbacteria bacterium]|jgi:RimJ/RimL family protein N-acetyltransferase|nr:GNAT family N-acetyltransferase [Candidatus Margulisiibacteriota bacterium]